MAVKRRVAIEARRRSIEDIAGLLALGVVFAAVLGFLFGSYTASL